MSTKNTTDEKLSKALDDIEAALNKGVTEEANAPTPEELVKSAVGDMQSEKKEPLNKAIPPKPMPEEEEPSVEDEEEPSEEEDEEAPPMVKKSHGGGTLRKSLDASAREAVEVSAFLKSLVSGIDDSLTNLRKSIEGASKGSDKRDRLAIANAQLLLSVQSEVAEIRKSLDSILAQPSVQKSVTARPAGAPMAKSVVVERPLGGGEPLPNGTAPAPQGPGTALFKSVNGGSERLFDLNELVSDNGVLMGIATSPERTENDRRIAKGLVTRLAAYPSSLLEQPEKYLAELHTLGIQLNM